MNNRLISPLLLLAAIWTLSGCGGTSSVADGGMGGTGMAYGTITEIGSIWVNGVEFDTDGATIKVEGEADVIAGVGPDVGNYVNKGMVVLVVGTINSDGVTGVAETVTYQDSLEGPICATTANTITVMEQKILIDANTLNENGDPVDIGALVISDVVEVSGFNSSNGDIYARYLEDKGASTEFEIEGVVKNSIANQFEIGTLVVNTTNAVGVAPSDGDYVEVKASSYTCGGALAASEVSVSSSGSSGSDADDAEVEGIVTDDTLLPNSFKLNGQTVEINTSTAFSGGLLADIKSGVHLEVEGKISNGVLTAEEIEFEDGVELEGDVVSINPLELRGLNGITILVEENLTQCSGVVNDCGLINAAHHLQVRARDYGGGTVLATEVEVQGGLSLDAKLQGPVDSFIFDSIEVMGITVTTLSFTDPDFVVEQDGGEVTGRDNFYAILQVGDLVELEGSWNGATMTIDWESVELDR